ncbi:MAG: Gfo/Idh/MocA family oxidoreductase [Verrucomicrobiales bacterium]|nr:Gfo/Idh/MocA family oxidoreductase [Verrucomicrobiales bacterium]HQW30339.1 Gfo/Idh/MocA family oxidoreductase [Verrucomicrobiales bacterium]
MSVKVGVIGVGAIGRNHARIYAALESAELVAIYDANLEHARQLAEEFGTEAVGSVEELVERVDAASVATPTVTHREIATKLLSAGKHVLVEKPISDSVDDAKAMIALASEKGCVLQVGHIERFNPVMSQLESRLNSPKFIECHRLSPFPQRSLDIGVVLDLMIHDLEIVLHLVNSPIATIDAVGIPVLTRREDIANARIRFENGCVANITASRISPERLRKIRVFQSDAYLSLDYQEQSGWIYRKDGMTIAKEEVLVERDEPLKCELAAFVDCAARGEQPKVSGLQGAAALDVALEITRLIEAAG